MTFESHSLRCAIYHGMQPSQLYIACMLDVTMYHSPPVYSIYAIQHVWYIACLLYSIYAIQQVCYIPCYIAGMLYTMLYSSLLTAIYHCIQPIIQPACQMLQHVTHLHCLHHSHTSRLTCIVRNWQVASKASNSSVLKSGIPASRAAKGFSTLDGYRPMPLAG